MLKITKGLNPYINKDVEDWILTYTDDDGNQYVRVKIGDEDFCIATHDYIKDDKQKFTWNEAMKIVKEIGMSLPTKKQVELYRAHHNEINDKLKETEDITSARHETTQGVKTGLFAILTRLFALNDSGVDKCEGADVAPQKREILGLEVLIFQYLI